MDHAKHKMMKLGMGARFAALKSKLQKRGGGGADRSKKVASALKGHRYGSR